MGLWHVVVGSRDRNGLSSVASGEEEQEEVSSSVEEWEVYRRKQEATVMLARCYSRSTVRVREPRRVSSSLDAS